MGSVEGNELAGAPGMVMPPFWSDVWFTSRRVYPKRAWFSVDGERVQSYSDARPSPRVMACPMTPEVRLPLPSGRNGTGLSSSRR